MTAIPYREALLAATSWPADHLDDPHLAVVDMRGSIKRLGIGDQSEVIVSEWESDPGNPIEKGEGQGT